MDHQNARNAHAPRRFAEGNRAPSVGKKGVSDRIVTAVAAGGTIFIAAGITTNLVREAQQRHQLTQTVSTALGRLITGAALLGTKLKGRERISLQIAGEGELRTLVADACLTQPHEIGVRGYTSVTNVEPSHVNGKSRVALAIGKGWLQVTRSYEVGRPYMGIVALASGEIADDIAQYLLQSEQIPSVVSLGVITTVDSVEIAGGVLAQLMPGAPESAIETLRARARAMPPISMLIENGATPEVLAQSLAGAYDMHAQNSYDVCFYCRCTLEKVELALMSLGRDEILQLIEKQEETEAVCEFCKRSYALNREELHALVARLDEQKAAEGDSPTDPSGA
jgi:molecular chaperone Hsp33